MAVVVVGGGRKGRAQARQWRVNDPSFRREERSNEI
jgi:hypothetical protein